MAPEIEDNDAISYVDRVRCVLEMNIVNGGRNKINCYNKSQLT